MTSSRVIRRVMQRHDHRPWPMPGYPWAMAMQWHTLLFAHWPVDAHRLRAALPDTVELDLFDDQAWLGVVPFGMAGVRLHGLPAVWPIANFLELSVRTYVVVDGKPGVWFFSLDAASRLSVRGARWSFGLPYFDARMHLDVDEQGWATYQSTRTHRGAPPATLNLQYRPVGAATLAEPGSLEQFLYERYCLYSVRRGTPLRGEIHHPPWSIQAADLRIDQLDMTRQLDLTVEGEPALLHYADQQNVVAWPPVPA